MNHYPGETYDYPTDRSPSSLRYQGVQRQTSRHFPTDSNFAATIFTADDPHMPPYHLSQDFRNPASTMHGGHYPSNAPYESQTWNHQSYANGANTVGGTGRVKQNSRRPPIPSVSKIFNYRETSESDMSQQWDNAPQAPFGLMPMHDGGMHYQPSQSRTSPPMEQGGEEATIPTAIVIKNIPFAVKKEQLQDLMQQMQLPLPYAFNYHFDNGIFRGLAFANFTDANETRTVITAMNQMELAGRKLRVEYKKMLPPHERDRIERDKRERRGQLQEQHQPMSNGQLHNQGSMNSLSSNIPATSPSPVNRRADGKPGMAFHTFGSSSADNLGVDYDLNDPATLAYYTELTLFKNDQNRESLVFPPNVTPEERRTIHTLAHHMGLEHKSEGHGEQRQVQILKSRIPAAVPQIGQGFYNESRRGLNRAATVDFTESRASDTNYEGITGLRRQASHMLDIPGSPGAGLSAAHNLRGAKSFADLRSFSPSPVPSLSSFPSNAAQNISSYNNYHNTNSSGAPTPTSGGPSSSRDPIREDLLLANFSGLGISERSIQRPNYAANAGPIGSQRPINGVYDEAPRNGSSVLPQRQPKGPTHRDWENAHGPAGFSSRPRQNGHINRGSGEIDLNATNKIWDDNRV